jgi:mRNA-degrading endonuclease RelE of RelBE toxin-antitoxin system
MEILANSAIQAQLSTMPEADQDRVDSMLQRLAQHPESVRDHLRRRDDNLWEFRITSRLLALVRIEKDRIELLAVARPDQLDLYRKSVSA